MAAAVDQTEAKNDDALHFPYSFFQDVAICFQEENPKRGHAHDKYEHYKSARTIKEFFTLGGTTKDFKHDSEHGFVRIIGKDIENENNIARIAELESEIVNLQNLLENRVIDRIENNALTPISRRSTYNMEQYQEVSKALFGDPLQDAFRDTEQYGFTFRVHRNGRVQEKKMNYDNEEYQTLKFPMEGSDRWIITRPTDPKASIRHTITIQNLIVQAYYPCFTSIGSAKEIIDTGRFHMKSKRIDYYDTTISALEGKYSVENIFVRPTDAIMNAYYKDPTKFKTAIPSNEDQQSQTNVTQTHSDDE